MIYWQFAENRRRKEQTLPHPTSIFSPHTAKSQISSSGVSHSSSQRPSIDTPREYPGLVSRTAQPGTSAVLREPNAEPTAEEPTRLAAALRGRGSAIVIRRWRWRGAAAAGFADSWRRGWIEGGPDAGGVARGLRTGSGVLAMETTPLGVRISHIHAPPGDQTPTDGTWPQGWAGQGLPWARRDRAFRGSAQLQVTTIAPTVPSARFVSWAGSDSWACR